MSQQEDAIVRKEHLCKLAEFCQALDAALRATGMSPEQCQETFRKAVSAECVGCGIHVSGDELYALSQPPSAELASVKTGRLRLGDCAREGCQAWYYRVSLWPHGQLDWAKLLAGMETEADQEHKPVTTTRPIRLPWKRLIPWRLLPRIGIAFAVILVLLLVRQWQQGGRIPLLREPEKFHVDVAPEEQSEKPTAEAPGGQ